MTEQEKLAYQQGYRAGYLDGLVAGKEGLTDLPELLQLPVEALGLSARPLNCLRAYRCQQVQDVAGLPKETILRMRNLGKKSGEEIVQALHRHRIFGTAWDLFLR